MASGQPLRRRDVVVAGHSGDAETARRGLDSADPGVRASAIAALDRLGALDDAEVAALLSDADPEVRRRALGAAARRDGGRVRVDHLLDDEHSLVAETAAFTLGEQTPPNPAAVPRLIHAARQHTDHLVREAAVAALGSIGDPQAVDTVIAALDERATIRRRAVLALAAFDGPEVEAALRRCVDDRDRQVRQAAEDLLAD